MPNVARNRLVGSTQRCSQSSVHALAGSIYSGTPRLAHNEVSRYVLLIHLNSPPRPRSDKIANLCCHNKYNNRLITVAIRAYMSIRKMWAAMISICRKRPTAKAPASVSGSHIRKNRIEKLRLTLKHSRSPPSGDIQNSNATTLYFTLSAALAIGGIRSNRKSTIGFFNGAGDHSATVLYAFTIRLRPSLAIFTPPSSSLSLHDRAVSSSPSYYLQPGKRRLQQPPKQ